ncbi:SCO1-SenC domain-containing protein [Cephalotus follicularis]|uniref:SCO1-SenC domain-containing protein n=1 Tax=Cephalotus follicularis TaxID=3775 RepID=A0A1Q3C0B8_CEPFO|nr:SCO1-SenC domain-containing protein [Cephalotus follicularis]
MATVLSRNVSHLRNIRKHLYYHTLIKCRSSPSTEILHHRTPRHHPQSVIGVGTGFESLAINQRFLLSTSSSKVKSDGGQKSGDSKQSRFEAWKSVRGGPVSWLSLLLVIATGAGILVYYNNEKKRHIEALNNSSKAVKEGPSAGQAAIGGPFSLINHDGKHVTDKDFLGKWTIIYFGFTHCPDICPDELQKLAAAVDKIKEKTRIDIVPVFISVDPERDTVEQVREYVKEFHPKLVGLTGNPDEIKKVARAYRVYYMKTAEEDSDYLVDHSIVMYLMGPDMKFVKFFGKNNDVDTLTDGVIKEIKEYKK